ncbi:glycoside hydrolase family 97 protein [Sphingomonas faeni]|uniref:glycoside hydrolase family 97 protein n=1 Tax=Sphingomonas faeni TaxID=185950 RepID=UPI0020C76736|nr:glycoside hydrolase family 97 protein [Sphingomonas faeni]MCP8890389.1 glycoside hydrolase family 97 protein [Sphingomonas faeni]
MRVLAALALLTAPAVAAAQDRHLRSPDGAIDVTIGQDPTTRGPTYAIAFHGRPLIDASPLGLAFEAYKKLGPDTAVTSAAQTSVDTRYRLIAGKTSAARDHYNELTLALAETGGARRRLEIVFRAYDDGVAFRYRLPVQPAFTDLRLAGELTEFAFPADYRCWGLNLGRFDTSHEGEYDPVQASQVRPHNLFEMPVTCRTGTGDTSFAITDADLHDYSGAYLTGRETGALGFATRLTPRLDDPAIAVKADVRTTGLTTPWRVVMLGDTPGKLIESTILTSLNPAPKGDFSWVKPGKTAWDWWNGPTLKALAGGARMNDATIKAYIDFAAANRLPYMLIDEGWYINSGGGPVVYPGADIMTVVPTIDLPGLVRYAADRNVGLWLWANWRVLDANMDAAFDRYAAMGIKGVKVDFMDRSDQQIVDFYQRIFKASADHRLMLDLHGAYHPTGATRTWPQFLTQEGVLGAEYNKWTRRITARHNVTLPFTRGLAGPYDYTPGGFRNATPATFRIEPQTPMVQTTRGQALAMYVVFDSPFMSVSDSPDNYAGAAGFDFLRAVPASWDETHVVSGAIGERIVTARRSGKDWYVGAMTDETPRTLDVPLDFLGNGRFTATIWQDGAAPTDVAATTRTVTAHDTISLTLAGSGGGAIRLVPIR